MKLEVGNIATSWTPAPEDVDGNIENVSSMANEALGSADRANALLEETTTEVSNLRNDVDNNSAEIEVITTNVSTLEQNIDGLSVMVGENTQYISSINNEIIGTNSKLETYFDFRTDGLGIRKNVDGQSTGFNTLITESALQFKKGEEVIAQATGSLFDMQNAKVQNTQTFDRDDQDNPVPGAWDITLKANGDLTFKWKEKGGAS